MPFKTILKNLIERVPGATGAILLDWEGEAVADFSKIPSLELPVIGAHNGVILNITKSALTNVRGENGVKTIGISTERAGIALSTVKDGYYLVVTVEKNGSMGRAFFESKRAIREIEREMG